MNGPFRRSYLSLGNLADLGGQIFPCQPLGATDSRRLLSPLTEKRRGRVCRSRGRTESGG